MKKLLLLLALLLPTSAVAADRYTSSTGSDTANNCGNIALPCNLANGFANEMAQIVAGAGDVLYMCIGPCNGSGAAEVATRFDSSLYTVPAGTTYANALTIKAYPGETVTIQTVWLATNASYVILSGFKVSSANIGGTLPVAVVNTSVHHIRHVDMEVSDGLDSSNIEVGFGSHHNEFINVNSHTCGTSLLHHGIYVYEDADDTLIDGGQYHGCAGSGVQIYSGVSGPRRVIVRNVRSYENGLGMFASGVDSLYSNNLIYDNAAHGFSTRFGFSSNNKYYANTIVGNGDNCLDNDSTDRGHQARNNVCWNNGGGIVGTFTLGTNLTTVDPLFTNQAAKDFTLTDKSPALNTCATLAEVPRDFLEVLRPQGSAYDCGAYEKADIIGGPGSGNTRTPVVTENCTGAAVALSTGYTQLSTVRTVNRDGSGKCTGSAFDDDPAAVVRSTGTFSATSQYAAGIVNSLGSVTDGTSYVTAGCFLSADQDGARDGYETYLWNVAGTVYTVAYKQTNGVLAQLPGGGRTDIAWPNGAVLAQECTPGRVVVMKDASVVLDIADSSHTTGKPGFGANGDALIDDIEMGDLNVTPGTCTINVQQPAAGSVNSRPNTTNVAWTTQNCTGNVTLQASWNSGTTWLPAFATVAFNSSPYTWDTVIGESATVKVRVCSGSDCGTSEAFTVHGEFLK